MFQQIRNLSKELRDGGREGDRSESLRQQLRLYEWRIKGTMRCTLWLNIAIVCFVLTVFLTGLSVLLPGNMAVIVATGSVMAAGLWIVVAAILGELWSNRLAKPTLDTELTTGTPDYEPVTVQQQG